MNYNELATSLGRYSAKEVEWNNKMHDKKNMTLGADNTTLAKVSSNTFLQVFGHNILSL